MRDCADDSGDPDAYYAAFARYHPLGRLASPEEIAAFVLCLLSPAAAFMTGIGDRDRRRQHGGADLSMDFAGKTILVTGSTRGIGAAAAELFLRARRPVILHGRQQEQVDAALAAAVDAACRPGARHRRRSRRPRAVPGAGAAASATLDVLVNCAGIFREVGDRRHHARRCWDETIAVNLTAPWVLVPGAAAGLRRRQGVIVNVGSDAAMLGYAGCVAYCASKGALVGLTRALAIELAPDVRALCVCPGPTETDMMQASVATAPDPEAGPAAMGVLSVAGTRRGARRDRARRSCLPPRLRARFLTGSVIMADGGATRRKAGLARPLRDHLLRRCCSSRPACARR